MVYRVGLEKGLEGPSVAWVLGHPGCFASGENLEQALDNLPDAIQNYIEWVYRNEAEPWLDYNEREFQIEETWHEYRINEEYEVVDDGYSVNAWFQDDWKPLTAVEIERGLKLLAWSREALLQVVDGLSPQELDASHPGERWSIRGILGHVGGAEWWYLDRLGLAFSRDKVPAAPSERLEVVRALLVEVMPTLEGDVKVVGKDGEFWSPRKLLRRAVWHELDHVNHIKKLRT
jgi:predicted RNase H-like HicB family nuclease